jgi:hypothetical protein
MSSKWMKDSDKTQRTNQYKAVPQLTMLDSWLHSKNAINDGEKEMVF